MSSSPSSERYALIEDSPNNAMQRHYGVWDNIEHEHATLPDGTFCYGMLYGEAEDALKELLR